ncbi:MAG TPA: ABC transporter ATP-binding protein [Thermoanaerobaculia bacterium]|nr:ABC transporter ATP-binding protein [Thermoanaerobaculia bacterium]
MSVLRPASAPPPPLLRVENLRVALPSGREWLPAVDGVSLAISRGEAVALVGESGSGKTQLARAILGLSPAGARTSGRVIWDGRSLASESDAERNRWRGARIGLVFQDPAAAFDPVRTIGSQMEEAIRLHRRVSHGEARELAIAALSDAAYPEPEAALGEYAHRLSGGLAQRAYLAMALAPGPDLLVADEATASLDPTVAARVLERLDALRASRGLALLVVTHDLVLVAPRSDRVLVMYAGRIVEEGPASDVLSRPAHPYTRGLLRAAPRIEASAPRRGERYETIPGAPPSLSERDGSRCAFAPRCPERFDPCERQAPDAYPAGAGFARCFLHAPSTAVP